MSDASSSATSITSNPICFTLGMRWNSLVLNGDVHTHVLTPIFIVRASQNRGTRQLAVGLDKPLQFAAGLG